MLQRLKGWGKDPLLAVMCIVEMVGPSRFSHFENGEPVAVPCVDSWVQVAAVSRDQTRNTMNLMPSLMSQHLIDTYNIKPGIERIRANNGRQVLEAVTSNPRSLEGNRATFIVLNETHHWLANNRGHEMYLTVWGNASKMDGRYLAITNAYLPGEDSVAERMRLTYERIADGLDPDTGFLYDSIEAHPATPLTPEALGVVLPVIRGDATWLNLDTIIPAAMDASIPPARSRRMWLNQIVAGDDALLSPAQWDSLMNEGKELRAGDEIVLGFDGGKSDDSTALVALRVSDRCAFVLHLQEKPLGAAGEHWEVDRDRVDSAVHSAFRLYNVKAFYADVALWESYIDDWAEQYREQLSVKASGSHAVAWDMRSGIRRVTLAHEALLQSIFDGQLVHDGDRDLRRHALNAFRHENNYGVSFRKESRESSRKVDLYAALMLAHEALRDLRTKAKPERKRTGEGYFF